MKNTIKYYLTILLFIIYHHKISAQSVTDLSAINNYIEFANGQTEYLTKMMYCLHNYHQGIESFKKNNHSLGYYQNYVCSNQLERYYYEKALKENTGRTATLQTIAQELWAIMENLDKKCKEIEIYVRLEEYKNKDSQKSDQWLREIEQGFKDYDAKSQSLYQEVKNIFKNLFPNNQNDYVLVANDLQLILEREATFMRLWNYNFNQEIHTGWIVDQVIENINSNQEWLSKYENQFPYNLKYPTDHYAKSVISGVNDTQEIKRTGLDDYNMKAKKDDEHSNWVYKTLISYYNDVMVSFYNQFAESATQNGVKMIKSTKILPLFEFKEKKDEGGLEVQPFEDKVYTEISPSAQGNVINKQQIDALNNYLDFINESVRHNELIYWTLNEYQNSSERYRTMTDFTRKAPLTYTFDDYKLPVSVFTKALDESKYLEEGCQLPIITQITVLMDILKELEQWILELQDYTKNKVYETDHLEKSDKIVQRFEVLLNAFDSKKEKLYKDILKIYQSYPSVSYDNNWFKSGNALLGAVDEAYILLYQTKTFFKKESTDLPQTGQLEQLTKDVIINEYSNMGNIERIGKYNGLCPYNPYEDLPEASFVFIKKLKDLPNLKIPDYGTAPYRDFTYRYNEMVEYYNKFTTLSEINLLKTVRQPDLFMINVKSQSNIPVVETTKEEPITDSTSMEGYAYNNLVLLLDVSGSMNKPEKLPLLKESFKKLLSILRPEDQAAIVVYSGNAKVVLNSTSAAKIQKFNKVIDNLKSEGQSNYEDGVNLAYETVNENFDPSKNNRIILATDGEFKISTKSQNLVQDNAEKGVYLSIFHFSKNQIAGESLKNLATKGKGHFATISDSNIDMEFLKEAKAKKIK